ncbi:polysaccharide deacetylase family protein [Mucilaginibacter sp.]|uniref:polysaccharide deacetylase family protein n=1 Tax=Mucilaginibacter sp. TaxID=1882438 RepID=UPI003D0EC5B2
MERLIKGFIFFFLLLSHSVNAQQKITWPHHKKAVIVLTYDDALASQLKTAIPQLDAAHFKGTFFLTGMSRDAIPKWRAVSKNGHELANHTLYHPCLSATMPDNPVNDSQHYTIYGILREIDAQNNFLYAIDGKTTRTYAYPCTETAVGGRSYVDSLRRSGMIKYARIGGDMDAIITDFKKLDLLLVPSYGLDENASGAKLIAFVKKAEQSAGMGIFMFHGIGGDYITTPSASHQELINYLKKHKKTIWVATFQQAMDYVKSKQTELK